jgi:hypothetical protein
MKLSVTLVRRRAVFIPGTLSIQGISLLTNPEVVQRKDKRYETVQVRGSSALEFVCRLLSAVLSDNS